LSSGAQLLRASLEDMDGGWDVIMFHHSLEHVLDPRQTLAAARSLLSEGGRIIVRIPTVSSAAFDRYGKSWYQLDAPRHLSIPSRLGMQFVAKLSGLEVAATQDDSSATQFWRSEQIMSDAEKGDVQPARAPSLTPTQLRLLTKEADSLNHSHRGDQAAWSLRVSPTIPNGPRSASEPVAELPAT
jgi:hypothetical protein